VINLIIVYYLSAGRLVTFVHPWSLTRHAPVMRCCERGCFEGARHPALGIAYCASNPQTLPAARFRLVGLPTLIIIVSLRKQSRFSLQRRGTSSRRLVSPIDPAVSDQRGTCRFRLIRVLQTSRRINVSRSRPQSEPQKRLSEKISQRARLFSIPGCSSSSFDTRANRWTLSEFEQHQDGFFRKRSYSSAFST